MRASKKRIIKPGREYDHLFPAADGQDETIKRNAGLDDTLAFIPKVVASTLHHTKGISHVLKGRSVVDTCRNIWQFVYSHIAYLPDREGTEQIRNPARIWEDRFTGVDCDCYSTFIGSILTNLGIPYKLRITKYKRDYQHIYPIVPHGKGYITLDCVVDDFDYEVPFSGKKDITMDLQYLSGLQDTGGRGADLVFDGYQDEMDGLGAGPKKKKKGFFRKVLSKINKINPATILLRNGFLAAMKLNLFKVASRIKYAYLSPEDAAKRGIIPDKYQKLVKVKEKLENIFETAGGNPKNLKKAILKGKGNKNKEVALSGFLPADMSVMYMDSNTPLQQLLGPDIYYSENVEGMESFQGFGALGEPATGAAIAAASAAVAAIAKIIKSIGNIFGGKQQGSEDFSEGAAAAADKEIASTPADNNSAGSEGGTTARNATAEAPSYEPPAAANTSDTASPATTMEIQPAGDALPATTVADALPVAASTSSGSNNSPPAESFWQKNKKWLLPTAIAVGGISIVAIGMKMLNKSPKGKPVNGLEGIPRRKKKAFSKKKKHQHKRGKKQSVALL